MPCSMLQLQKEDLNNVASGGWLDSKVSTEVCRLIFISTFLYHFIIFPIDSSQGMCRKAYFGFYDISITH